LFVDVVVVVDAVDADAVDADDSFQMSVLDNLLYVGNLLLLVHFHHQADNCVPHPYPI
jgi:hypothetical protein